MEHKVCVIGGATWDALFTTAQADLIHIGGGSSEAVLAFPYGGKVDAVDVTYGFGGGGANVAVSLAHLGVTVDIITRVGCDSHGDEVINNLRKFGVATRYVQKDKRNKTALAFIVTAGQGRDHVAFVARGATQNLNIPLRLPIKYQWTYVTAVAALNWYKRLAKLFRDYSQQGGNIFWNPGAMQLAEPKKVVSLLKYVTVIDLNNDEAADLVKKIKGKRVSSIIKLVSALKEMGPKYVLVTAGRGGAYLHNGSRVIHHPVYRVKPVNTTGAGDAFGAGFLAGYLASGWNLNVAMQWGMLNSNSVIMHVGAQKGILSLSTLPKFRAIYDPT